jgi:hypothetical protein
MVELLKGSRIDIIDWYLKEMEIFDLMVSLNEIISENDINSPAITVKQLNDIYKGIDWMRLLNGIFLDTKIDIKLDDLVQVPDHHYLSQLSNVIRNQTNE